MTMSTVSIGDSLKCHSSHNMKLRGWVPKEAKQCDMNIPATFCLSAFHSLFVSVSISFSLSIVLSFSLSLQMPLKISGVTSLLHILVVVLGSRGERNCIKHGEIPCWSIQVLSKETHLQLYTFGRVFLLIKQNLRRLSLVCYLSHFILYLCGKKF